MYNNNINNKFGDSNRCEPIVCVRSTVQVQVYSGYLILKDLIRMQGLYKDEKCRMYSLWKLLIFYLRFLPTRTYLPIYPPTLPSYLSTYLITIR